MTFDFIKVSVDYSFEICLQGYPTPTLTHIKQLREAYWSFPVLFQLLGPKLKTRKTGGGSHIISLWWLDSLFLSAKNLCENMADIEGLPLLFS